MRFCTHDLKWSGSNVVDYPAFATMYIEYGWDIYLLFGDIHVFLEDKVLRYGVHFHITLVNMCRHMRIRMNERLTAASNTAQKENLSFS